MGRPGMWDNEREPPEGRGSREDMWGIRRRDGRWFQVLTLIGGTAGSIGLTVLQIKHRSAADTPDAVALNILLGVGASFIAAGFVSWGLLQIKELIMAIADWVREATEKRRQRIRAEGIAEGVAEGYRRGYQDATQGKPPEVPSKPAGQTPPRESDKAD